MRQTQRESLITNSAKRAVVAGGATSPLDYGRSAAPGAARAWTIVWQWAALIAAAAVAPGITRGSAYHQLAIGVLLALVSVAIGLAAIELLWRLAGFGWSATR